MRKRIPDLEVTVEDNIRKLITAAQESITKLPQQFQVEGYGQQPTYTYDGVPPVEKKTLESKVAVALAAIGDTDAARRVVNTLPTLFDRELAYHDIAFIEAKTGDLEAAKRTNLEVSETNRGLIPSLEREFHSSQCSSGWESAVEGLSDRAKEGGPSVAPFDLMAFLSLTKKEKAPSAALEMLDGAIIMAQELAVFRDCSNK